MINLERKGICVNYRQMVPNQRYFVSNDDLQQDLKNGYLSFLERRAKELNAEIFYYEVYQGYVIVLKNKLRR